VAASVAPVQLPLLTSPARLTRRAWRVRLTRSPLGPRPTGVTEAAEDFPEPVVHDLKRGRMFVKWQVGKRLEPGDCLVHSIVACALGSHIHVVNSVRSQLTSTVEDAYRRCAAQKRSLTGYAPSRTPDGRRAFGQSPLSLYPGALPDGR
jgi:hypothetical protein